MHSLRSDLTVPQLGEGTLVGLGGGCSRGALPAPGRNAQLRLRVVSEGVGGPEAEAGGHHLCGERGSGGMNRGVWRREAL